jgi:hypothetical protein
MNELSDSVKWSKAPNSSKGFVSHVEISVDDLGKVTITSRETRVPNGDIHFHIGSPDWRFAPDGIQFDPTRDPDGNPVPDGLFTLTSWTDREIVFHDRYDINNPAPDDTGRFHYKVNVERIPGVPFTQAAGPIGLAPISPDGVVVNM